MSYGISDTIKKEEYSDVVVKATSQGKIVVPSDDRTLQIDIDSEEDFERWEKGKELLGPLGIENFCMTVSSSGGPHRHVTVKLKEPADVWKRIALQVLLGSHITREMLNAYRVLSGCRENPIVFFEKENKPQPPRSRMLRI